MCFSINKCVFCISLATGTKVISILSLLTSMATVVVYAGAAASVPAAAQSKQCFYMMVAAGALGHTFISGLLIYGVFWSKPSYVWPWLVTSWISCSSLLLLSVLGVVLLTIQYYQDMETFADISAMSTFYFVYAVILYYCVTVVQSRRMQMKRTEETESSDVLMRNQHHRKNSIV